MMWVVVCKQAPGAVRVDLIGPDSQPDRLVERLVERLD